MHRIVIAGGTGLLGTALRARLRSAGFSPVLLSRRATSDGPDPSIQWQPDGTVGAWARALEGAAAVVNLAGESIAGRRWTPARKRAILDSRVTATRSLATAIAASTAPPPVFLSASGIGYYGPHGDDNVTEQTPVGADFLAGVCAQWEQEAEAARSAGVRVVTLRTGLVLDRRGGALPEMLPPFRFGVGGPLGSGRQFWPWIHVDDWVSLVLFALESDTIDGPVNLTAPAPVTNREFAATLGRVLRRPAFVPAPAFALRIILGEMTDALVTGQRALPQKALDAGFTFRFTGLEPALQDLLRT
jgi:uncharacterized protein (TIGR01777 family)